MKKVLFSLIILTMLILPTSVFASSSLTIECDENNVAGQALICTLKTIVEDENTFNKIEGDINISDATTTFEWESGITGNINNNKLTIVSDKQIQSITLGKLKIKYPVETKGTKSINISNIKLYEDNTFVTTINNASDEVQIKSDVKTLQTLSIEDCDGCKLNPGFKSNLTIYNLTTSSDSIRITAIANGEAKVFGTGLKNITKDQETFEIIVTSEAGNTKTYKINVKRVAPLSSDNSLKSLTIDGGELNPKFSSDVTSYTTTVNDEKTVINAIAIDSKAKVTGLGTKILEYGKNDFNITVTAENGTSKNYLIVINRPDDRNTNAYLKELTINGQQIGFEKDIIEYSYNMKNNANKLEIVAKAELETSEVTISGNEDLQIGENEIIITVKAEDGSTKEYKVIVIKPEIKEKELNLLSLNIEGYDIPFESSKFEYNITIKNEKKLNITAVPIDENYNVQIKGNDNLKEGSIIKIFVTDESGKSNVYKIKISTSSDITDNTDNVAGNNNSEDINYIPYIMIGILIILVILNIVQISKRSRKK